MRIAIKLMRLAEAAHTKISPEPEFARRRILKGLGGSHPTLSANQSSIFSFSAEKSKMRRTFALFVRLRSTGEAQIRSAAAHLCAILSVETRAGALSRPPCHEPLSVRHADVSNAS